MTDREKAIVMAYTGIVMLAGEKFSIFHEYVEEIMERPVQTFEFVSNTEEIKRRATPDFIRLCRKTTADAHGHWIEENEDWNVYKCSCCGETIQITAGSPIENNMHFCWNCGAKMNVVNEND